MSAGPFNSFFSCRHAILLAALSVRQSVGPSVWGHQVEKWENEHLDTFSCGLQRLQSFICRSVGPSICRSVEVMESKSGKMSVIEAFCVSVCVGKGVGWSILTNCQPFRLRHEFL